MIFIEATTEPFNEVQQGIVAGERENPPISVRRPTRGYQLKEQSFAMMRIVGADGQFFNVIDAAGEYVEESQGVRKTHRYTNFFVQSVTEKRQEKKQVVDNFGDPIIILFGQAPRVVNVTGQLLNTADFNWLNEFWHNYDNYFRGTRLAEMGARLYLIYDDRIVEGLMINAQAQKSTNSRVGVKFQFSMFVTGTSAVSQTGNPNFPNYSQTARTRSNNDLGYDLANLVDESDIKKLDRERVSQKLLNLNEMAFIEQGVFNSLSEMIRNGFIDSGSPDISLFMARAKDAMGSSGDIDLKSERTTPLRGKFVDNIDEFIGGSPQRDISESSQRSSWEEMDNEIDNEMTNIMNEPDFNEGIGQGGELAEQPDFTTSTEYNDMMGRPGRANQNMQSNGASRRHPESRANSVRPNTSGESLRDVPFGTVAVS